MKLFNSITNKKEDFVSVKEGQISLYLCGPTVYNHAHIGNVRPMIIFDVLRRIFEYRHLKVIFVSNYTDVDDKIIQGAKEEGLDEITFSKKYITAYEKIRNDLNIKQPTYTPKVSETIEEIIAFIKILIEKDFAYESEGDVYFNVEQLVDYGIVSKIKIKDLLDGASERVEINDKKQSPLDFVLWKKSFEGISWESPWSNGRPGWHTECVVMIDKIFGDKKIDIHGGGHDLKFPHHENEVAQSLAYHGHYLANFWMHNNLLNIDNQKMSKSIGNVMWAKDVINDLGGNVVRWLMLSTHYRNPLNYTNDVIKAIVKEVGKVEHVIKQAGVLLQLNDIKINQGLVDNDLMEQLVVVLEDDLNTSLGLTLILEHVKRLNLTLRINKQDFKLILNQFETLKQMLNLFGFDFNCPILSKQDKTDYKQWEKLKRLKSFDEADELRKSLLERRIL
jgi:cysteinyl-tRNA synthetase